MLWLVSHEEARVEDALRRIVDGTKTVHSWSATEPFPVPGRALDPYARGGLDGHAAAVEALGFVHKKVRDENARAVWVLRDFEPYLEHPLVVRRLRDLAFALKRSYSTLVFLSPILHVPPALDKDITVVDYDLPAPRELGEILDEMLATLPHDARPTLDDFGRERVIQAARGLTADEAANAFARSLVASDGTRLDVAEVLAEKKQIIRKSRALEFYEAQSTFDSIGGLEPLKSWLKTRGGAFSERAREYGLPSPRGVLLLGVPGCGKSLTARAIGAAWNLPLLRFDVGSVFGKYVGESEANLRRALAAAEAVAPCVLWIDEMEKAFSASRGDDGGTALRILGGFLSWLQDKKSDVFVVATANSVEALPPELLRRGRLDEIFFVDLPGAVERAEIFRIHLRKRGRDPEPLGVEVLASQSEGFSGAEIEQVVLSALYDAFEAGRDIHAEDITRAASHMVPLSRTMEEEISRLRDWASTRARPASDGA
jgi:ATP-dependent 26S proteasome regulatory subunit